MKYKRIIKQVGSYRILEVEDWDVVDLEMLKGDSYNPKVNPDIDPKILAQEERDFELLVEVAGVYGYVLEKWSPEVGEGWMHVESCYGFIGEYNKEVDIYNHYIVDEFLKQIEG